MNPMSKPLTQLQSCLSEIPESVDRVVLAFSGGLDSCVLLHLLVSEPRPFAIKLWHVNHGLQQQAAEMASFCQAQAAKYAIEITVSELNLSNIKNNIEARARKARYDLFASGINASECLLTAHHADDQAETFFLNALRGSGSAGLRGIASSKDLGRGRLIRPLLAVSRASLLAYAEQHQLQWFDDPSNESLRFDRNYLRHQVMPNISTRWPHYLASIAGLCSIQSETQTLLDEFGALDFARLQLASARSEPVALNREALLELSSARQKNVLRFWLRQQRCASLPRRKLNELISQLAASDEAQPLIIGTQYDIRIYRQGVYIVKHEAAVELQPVYQFGREARIGISELGLQIERQALLEYFQREDEGQDVEIRFRLDRMDQNPQAHRLKRLFQTQAVPPWRRERTAQVYLNNELVGLLL